MRSPPDGSQSHQGRGNLPETGATHITGGGIYPRREPLTLREGESTRDGSHSHQGRGNLPETGARRGDKTRSARACARAC
eukprot:5191196-Pyramimonas_sp.AAC.1